MATKTTVSAKDAKILDMVFNPEGTMLPDKETENMLNSEPVGTYPSSTPSPSPSAAADTFLRCCCNKTSSAHVAVPPL
jgi:hypothetical protein